MTWSTVTEYLSHKWRGICSTCSKHFLVLSSFMTYHQVYNWSNTTGATIRTGTAYPSGAPEFAPMFSGVCVNPSLVFFYLVFCRLLFVLLFIVFSVLRFTDSDYTFGISLLMRYQGGMNEIHKWNACDTQIMGMRCQVDMYEIPSGVYEMPG
jgi:hypothetical protein